MKRIEVKTPEEISPFGDLKNVEVAEQELTLKPGNIWGGIDPAKGVDESIYQNACLWYNGTLRAVKGHDVRTCKWHFDGQIWKHL